MDGSYNRMKVIFFGDHQSISRVERELEVGLKDPSSLKPSYRWPLGNKANAETVKALTVQELKNACRFSDYDVIVMPLKIDGYPSLRLINRLLATKHMPQNTPFILIDDEDRDSTEIVEIQSAIRPFPHLLYLNIGAHSHQNILNALDRSVMAQASLKTRSRTLSVIKRYIQTNGGNSTRAMRQLNAHLTASNKRVDEYWIPYLAEMVYRGDLLETEMQQITGRLGKNGAERLDVVNAYVKLALLRNNVDEAMLRINSALPVLEQELEWLELATMLLLDEPILREPRVSRSRMHENEILGRLIDRFCKLSSGISNADSGGEIVTSLARSLWYSRLVHFIANYSILLAKKGQYVSSLQIADVAMALAHTADIKGKIEYNNSLFHLQLSKESESKGPEKNHHRECAKKAIDRCLTINPSFAKAKRLKESMERARDAIRSKARQSLSKAKKPKLTLIKGGGDPSP